MAGPRRPDPLLNTPPVLRLQGSGCDTAATRSRILGNGDGYCHSTSAQFALFIRVSETSSGCLLINSPRSAVPSRACICTQHMRTHLGDERFRVGAQRPLRRDGRAYSIVVCVTGCVIESPLSLHNSLLREVRSPEKSIAHTVIGVQPESPSRPGAFGKTELRMRPNSSRLVCRPHKTA